jgi:hypothetical protein
VRSRVTALALVVTSFAHGAARADVVSVTIRPSAATESRDIVLEHDHTIVATCSALGTVTVPRGEYVVHELDGRREEHQLLTIDRSVDVEVVRADRCRKSLGWPLGIVSSVVAGARLVDLLSSSGVDHAGRDWALVAGGGALAIFGFWLESSIAASTHLDVKLPQAGMAIAPSPGGASLIVAGAF